MSRPMASARMETTRGETYKGRGMLTRHSPRISGGWSRARDGRQARAERQRNLHMKPDIISGRGDVSGLEGGARLSDGKFTADWLF